MVQVYTTNGRNYNDSIQENIVQKKTLYREQLYRKLLSKTFTYFSYCLLAESTELNE